MPGGDRTGPLGLGPGTGRAAGFCSGVNQPGYARSGSGRGRGMGLGSGYSRRGRGRRFRSFVSSSPVGRNPEARETAGPDSEREIRNLQRQAQELQAELSSIQKRLSELTNEN